MAEPAPDPQLPPRPAATPLDPTRPDSFPRRVLLCVVGLTPQVVTETLWALAVDAQPPFVPTELSIVTTSEGADRVDLVLTSGKQKLDALAADYPGRGLEGLARRTTVHVVRDEAGAALADIASLEANTALADLLVEVVRNLTDDTTSAVHLSIAGGRKTMGFLAGYALSLYGRPQDRLSHVLVDPAFEQHADFFYPPPEPVVLLSQSKDQKPIRTDRCGLVLADIPFVRLREGLPGDLLEGRASFAATVASLQERFRPPELVIDLERRSVRAHGRELRCTPELRRTRELRCTPMTLAFWAWLAERRCSLGAAAAVGREDLSGIHRFLDLYTALVGFDRRERAEKALKPRPAKNWFSERASRINKLVARALGPAAVHYRIEASGRRSETVWTLATPPEAIRLIGLP